MSIGGLTAAGPSYKCWAVLQGNTLTLYEEHMRGEKRVKTPLSLAGANVKSPPSSKKAAARAGSRWMGSWRWGGRRVRGEAPDVGLEGEDDAPDLARRRVLRTSAARLSSRSSASPSRRWPKLQPAEQACQGHLRP